MSKSVDEIRSGLYASTRKYKEIFDDAAQAIRDKFAASPVATTEDLLGMVMHLAGTVAAREPNGGDLLEALGENLLAGARVFRELHGQQPVVFDDFMDFSVNGVDVTPDEDEIISDIEQTMRAEAEAKFTPEYVSAQMGVPCDEVIWVKKPESLSQEAWDVLMRTVAEDNPRIAFIEHNISIERAA